MIDWKTYYYNDFPEELRRFSLTRIPEHHCEHCQAPPRRRCLINKNFPLEMPNNFRFAWYGITLYDQGLFKYFPLANPRWVSNTGGYPLPVEEIGFGCVRVVAPAKLLSTTDPENHWREYVAFWLQETANRFENMTGVTPAAFFDAIGTDRDFCNLIDGNSLEIILQNEARKCFQR